MHAIILDGELKSALTIVRSLGARHISLSVGAPRKTAMALHSRHAQHTFVYPSPYRDREAFVRAVKAEAVRLGGKPVVYTCSDATFLALYGARADLEAYMMLVYPEERSVEIAFDKAATYSLARVSGVPTITTHLLENRSEVERLSETLQYPAVVKTRRSVTWQPDGKGVFGSASFVGDKASLITTWEAVRARVGEAPLVQDLVVGEEYGVEMVARDGRALGIVVHHRIRSLSPTGGASVLKETLGAGELKDTLMQHAVRLVEALSWTGPIMVEFKVDADTREPKLMEINGRFWGSLPLSVAAGVDMPYLYYLLATGEVLPEAPHTARDGVVSCHFLGDILHVCRVLFARDRMRPFLYPKRSAALRNFLTVSRGVHHDVWSWQDPLPALYEIIDMIQKRICK